jgi:hypothetical protein
LSFEFKIVRWILILSGGFLMTAFLAVFLPVQSMQSMHERLGLGEFPVAPITDYLARSTSLLYGVHGSILFYTGLTIQHHWRFVPLLGWLHIVIGMAMLGIDLAAPMPTYWTAMEGGPVAAVGVLMLFLFKKGSPTELNLSNETIPTNST